MIALKVGLVGFATVLIPFAGKYATAPGSFKSKPHSAYARKKIYEGEGLVGIAGLPGNFIDNFTQRFNRGLARGRFTALPPVKSTDTISQPLGKLFKR